MVGRENQSAIELEALAVRGSKPGLEFWLRWLPPVVLLGCLVTLLLIPAARQMFSGHWRELSVAILLIWLVAAVAIATVRHVRFVRNVRKATALEIAGILAGLGLLLVLSSQQYISPGWILLFLLTFHLVAATENPRVSLAAVVFVTLVTLAITEVALALPLKIPSVWRAPGLSLVAKMAYWGQIQLIQYIPECAQWDSDLSYTLKPGTCTFGNPGYKNEYRINRLGVRDDEESLTGPEIIVLGDSHAMGMGVEQHETFASRLEQMTGLKTLNTGISSYGTAREFGMLQRIDRSRLRYLLIQHCSNDRVENREYVESGGRLPSRSLEWYQSQVSDHKRWRRYHPGKYVVFWSNFVLDRIQARLAPPSGDEASKTESLESMEDLLRVIEMHPVDISGFDTIIFEMDFPAEYHPTNIPLLHRLLAEKSGNSRLRRIRVVDVMKGLGPEHFIALDGHMNALGHWRVAERVAQMIE